MSIADETNCFPLSLSQLNILNLERALVGTSVNNISTTMRIRGRVDFNLLQQSINRVLESDASLRTQLIRVDGQMMQYHAPFLREEFPVYDFSNTSSEGVESWENAVTRELIPLEAGPLYRFVLFRDSENSGGILVKLHHIISDGWSQVMLCNKIGKTYLELLSGKEPSLEEAPDYQLHVQEEQDYLSSRAFRRDEAYWKGIAEKIGEVIHVVLILFGMQGEHGIVQKLQRRLILKYVDEITRNDVVFVIGALDVRGGGG